MKSELDKAIKDAELFLSKLSVNSNESNYIKLKKSEVKESINSFTEKTQQKEEKYNKKTNTHINSITNTTQNYQNQNKQPLNTKNNYFEIGESNKTMLNKYLKQLRLFNFPDLPLNLGFESDEEIELFFKFLDHIIYLKSTIIEEKKGLQATIQNLKYQNEVLINNKSKLEREIELLNNKNKDNLKLIKNKQEINHQQENKLEKDFELLNSNYKKLSVKLNQSLIERKQIQEKFGKLSEAYNKLQMTCSFNIMNKSNKPIIINSIETTDNLKRNNLLKRLSQINGSELLIDCFKNGYNESLKEVVFEVMSLKNFLIDVNNEIISYIKVESNNSLLLNENIVNLSFIDSYDTIKNKIFSNIEKARESYKINHNILNDEELLITDNEIFNNQHEDIEQDNNIINENELEVFRKKWIKVLNTKPKENKDDQNESNQDEND